MTDYQAFVRSKQVAVTPAGFEVSETELSPRLFDWQRRIVRWALRLGRAALFEECGLGKTGQQLEWARHVAAHTGGRVLILTPLAVAHQTVAEGAKFAVPARYCRSQAEADAATERVIVANYEMLKAFDPGRFAGVVLDESSILKAYAGKTKKAILAAFAQTHFRLCCTATPAPNDHMELGNHAEFLGVMRSTEMLQRWFINDTMKAGDYRLKRHAEADFWRWVTSWAVCLSRPGDLGYPDGDFALPPLQVNEELVAVDHTRAHERGELFIVGDSLSATELWREKRATAPDRARRAAEIVATGPERPWIVWCDTNDEADKLQALIPEAVEVRGSDSIAEKERKLSAFSDGEARIIITKPDLAGFGLNWQHCADMVFCGVTYSFEKTYQALRRSWRFGQARPVNVYIIYAESEGNILTALREKQEAHRAMQTAMNDAMRHNGLSLATDHRSAVAYDPQEPMFVPEWICSRQSAEPAARRLAPAVLTAALRAKPSGNGSKSPSPRNGLSRNTGPKGSVPMRLPSWWAETPSASGSG